MSTTCDDCGRDVATPASAVRRGLILILCPGCIDSDEQPERWLATGRTRSLHDSLAELALNDLYGKETG